jgi:hypothetical protein
METADNPLSHVRGYNNASGLLYNTMNGLRQYQAKQHLYPIYSNPYPKYSNPQNVKDLLRTGRDNKVYKNKGGKQNIPKLPNSRLEDGGFKNTGKTIEQERPARLKITKKAMQLAQSAVVDLPLQPETVTSEDKKMLNKFNSFLSNLGQGGKTQKEISYASRTG